jgi:hypothetical protein
MPAEKCGGKKFTSQPRFLKLFELLENMIMKSEISGFCK